MIGIRGKGMERWEFLSLGFSIIWNQVGTLSMATVTFHATSPLERRLGISVDLAFWKPGSAHGPRAVDHAPPST